MAVALTTKDNPWSPFDDYDKWNNYDTSSGYHTASLVGRVVPNTDGLTQADEDRLIEEAIDNIITNVKGPDYVKLKKP